MDETYPTPHRFGVRRETATPGSEQIVTFRSPGLPSLMTSGTRARGSRPAAGGPPPLRPLHPPHLRWRIQGRNFSAYSPWRSHLPPARSSARRADLQKLRNPAKAPGCPDLFLLSEGNAADTSSELQFCVVAGVGFEPT